MNFNIPGWNRRKLIIVSRSRTGSNNLKSLLNQSSDIVIAGEVFGYINDDQHFNRVVTKYLLKPRIKKYSGFKFFYYHPVNWNQRIWDLITDDTQRIIILVRKNIIKAEISRQRALQSNIWIERNTAVDKRYVALDEDLILSEVLKSIKDENDFIKYAVSNNLKFHILEFENLISNPENEVSRICEFLKIKKFKFGIQHEKTKKFENALLMERKIEVAVEKGLTNVDRSYQSYI